MTYEHAMGDYGSDKPDSRLGMKINRFEHLLPVDLISKISPLNQPIVDVMRLPLGQAFHDPDVSRKFISNFLDSAEAQVFVDNPDGGPGVFIYDSSKPLAGLQAFGFEAAEEVERLYDDIKDGDIVILQARTNAAFHGGSTPLGNLRLALHHKAVEQSLTSTPDTFEPLWVTDFPLFSPSISSEPGQGGSAGLASTHHPFTSPKSARDVELLLTDPTRAIGDHYDLVVNGVELGGGSRRIHNAAVQRFVLESVLRMDTSRVAEFAHLFEVLRAGCPPHAGIALGLDRLVAVMLGRESVRDVIAFPKGKRGEDLLVRSPGAMSEEVLRTYHLRVREVE
jgi:aspartyl-tRNA synthetase